MQIDFGNIPWLGVVAGTVAFAVLGGVWFGAIVAKLYARALDRPDLVGQKPSALAIAGPFVCGLVITLANALLMQSAGIASAVAAAGFGALVGIGYLTPMVVNIAINPNFPRPFLYSAINLPYFIAGNIANCLILWALR